VSDLEFKPFAKIARLNRDVVVTEKIDGTNALVHVSDDGSVVRAGSRTRWIVPGDDNFGFAAWVAKNEECLRRLGPGLHYGEWWGAGIQRRYGLTEKRFSLFNVGRWSDDATRPECCGVVPTLARGIGVDLLVSGAIERLRTSGSVAAPGFMNPEGVVVFHTASGSLFKVTCDKDEAPKGRAA
jgi:hypothetical protein